MPHATPGKWFIAVVCETCSHRTLLYNDLTEGKSDLGKTFVKVVCPNCKTEASRKIEHYQEPMVNRASK